MTVSTSHALRADAEANRLRILEAAAVVFAERGMQTSMAEVARCSRVGLATLFRRFPTKEHLLREILADTVGECRAELAEATRHPDAWVAFQQLISGLAEAQVDAGRLANEMVSVFLEGEAFSDEAAMVRSVVDDVAARAKASGHLTPDFSYADVLLLLRGNAGIIQSAGTDGAQQSRRYVEIMLRSFEA